MSLEKRVEELENDTPLVKGKEASIITTGIDIECLRVDGRNLTMSVFRQIPRDWFMNSEGFKGEIWGWVNYFWNGEDGDYHVIWEKENKLYRYPVSRDNIRSLYGYYSNRELIVSSERKIGSYKPEKAEEVRNRINELKQRNRELDEWIESIIDLINHYDQLYIAT